MAIDYAKLDRWFKYHPPRQDQIEQYEKIREAGRTFAKIVLDNTPPCADQSTSIRHIRDAVFAANASIACGGM